MNRTQTGTSKSRSPVYVSRLHEELLIGNNLRSTSHSRILKAHEDFIAWTDLEPKLNALEMVLTVNDVSVILLMIAATRFRLHTQQ